MSKWRVAKRCGEWRVLDPWGAWHDSCPTLEEAHTYASQLAIADALFSPGGLTTFRQLKGRAGV